MYTSYIGKKFIEYYKQEYEKPENYTAEQFFDEVMFPLFFDDERHLMSVKGSPFFQMNAQDGVKRKKFKNSNVNAEYISIKKDPVYRLQVKQNLKEKFQRGELGVHTFVGYGEMNPDALTSGQISNIEIQYNNEDFYFSWIGQALAIGTSALNVLFDEKQILLHIFKGWKFYRFFMSQNPILKENQINYWNGNWFVLTFNKNNELNYNDIKKVIKDDVLSIKSISWVQLIFLLCKNFSSEFLFSSVYTIGDKSNTTIGFINIFLKEIKKMYELRDLLFIDEKESTLTDNQIETLMPFYGFKDACMQGTLGLKSIEPKGLRKYIPKGSYLYSQRNDIDISKETNLNIYKLWIIAMLNKKELLDLSREFAAVLFNFVKEIKIANRSKTTDKQLIKDIFESKSSKQFVDITKDLIDEQNYQLLRNLVEEVVLMPRDNFPLFITLIKFEYSILQKKEN